MHNTNSGVLAHVSRNLKRLRLEAGFSQQLLADRSGISRRMIVSVENGDTNISLSSLDRLADALGVGFVDLVTGPAAENHRISEVMWQGKSPGSTAHLLGKVPAHREAQLWAWSLAPGERYQAEPDVPGWHEMIYVAGGRLRLELETGAVIIEAGDFHIFSSAQTYAYANAHEGVTRFIRTVVA